MNPEHPTAKARILCVDDDPTMREVLSHVLALRGFVVETARHGLEAWQRVWNEAEGIDLIVTDNQMPQLGGIDLVRRLRASKFLGRVILFTSTLCPEEMELALRLGVDAVVEKGTRPDLLVAEIRRLLQPAAAEPVNRPA